MYLDTAVLVKVLVREPDSDFYAGLVDGQPAWSSQLVLVECLSALLRKERERAIDRSHRRRAWRQVVADVGASRLNLVAVTPDLVERAAAILDVCHPAVALRSLDAIHLASAERCQSWPLCSNDVRLRAAAARLARTIHERTRPRAKRLQRALECKGVRQNERAGRRCQQKRVGDAPRRWRE